MMRRGYIDWLRGLAVVIMVEAHTLDAWTRPADRGTAVFGIGGIVGGFAAPLFLFLAGVAVPLSLAAKVRRGATVADAARAVRRRGWQVFGLALLFRLQARLLSGGPWRALLKVDILNIMGPAIALAAVVCALFKSIRCRLVALGTLVAFAALATPLVRSASWPAVLPDFLEGYLRPIPQLTNFTLFPWAGFVLAGACIGSLLSPIRDESSERTAIRWLAFAGAGLIAAGWIGSWLPSPYAHSYFWTSSPAFFALRLGILTFAVPLAFAWGRRSAARRWSPLQQLGRTSLFIYWIHVEMVYGCLSRPLHRDLSLREWGTAYALFMVWMIGLSVAKTRAVDWWSKRRPPAAMPTPAGA